MAQWSEVVSILQSSKVYPSDQVDPKLFVVHLQTDKGRSQDVYVGNVDDNVTFRSVVCEVNRVDLGKFMNTDFVKNVPYGLGVVGDFLALKHVQKLETLDIAELAAPIAELAHFADFIESALSGGDAF